MMPRIIEFDSIKKKKIDTYFYFSNLIVSRISTILKHVEFIVLINLFVILNFVL